MSTKHQQQAIKISSIDKSLHTKMVSSGRLWLHPKNH